MKRSPLVLALSLVPAIAAAHPGHGHTDPHGWAHYLTEPVHVVGLAAGAVALVFAISWQRSRARRRSARTSRE